MWYLEKGIEPNLKCLKIKTKQELRRKLLEIIAKIDPKSIQLDLEPLVEDEYFVKSLSKKIRDILTGKLSQNN